jgi:hypothetical protein
MRTVWNKKPWTTDRKTLRQLRPNRTRNFDDDDDDEDDDDDGD